MNIKKGKLLVIILFALDVLISVGVIAYKSHIFQTDFSNDIYRILIDVSIICLAYLGILRMKGLYMALLILTGLMYLFFSVGIFISESFKVYGLALLIAGIYYIIMFFLFVYSKWINDFFDDQQMKFKMKYNNYKMN